VEISSEDSAQDGSMIGLKRGRGFVLWDPSGGRPLVDVAEFPDRRIGVHLSPRGRVLTGSMAAVRLGSGIS